MSEAGVYAVKHTNNQIVSESRSGGFFTALSDYILNNHGVVYGCIMSSPYSAEHTRAENCQTRDQMRGSKYIQSSLGDTFKNVREDLENGRKVLFTGTPCQVAGLKQFLNKEYVNLYLLDILCHGVPSPAVWKQYIRWQEKKTGSRVKKVEFRNKKDFGWRAHLETMWFANGRKVTSRVFTTLFYKHCILRPCCYACPYKTVNRVGDISIADYWGIEKAAPEFDDNKGVSLVLVNSDKGCQLFEVVKKDIRWIQTRLEDSMQNALRESYAEPIERQQFWNDYFNMEFDRIAHKYGGDRFSQKLRQKIRAFKQNILNG